MSHASNDDQRDVHIGPHSAHSDYSGPHAPPPRYPTICRMVVYHYQRGGAGPLVTVPAVVQSCADAADPFSAVDLFVLDGGFLGGGGFETKSVPYGANQEHHWSWPPWR
jgi:hypothetical protein